MKIYLRNENKIENIKDQKPLIFLYKTKLGRIILKVITLPIFSKVFGLIIDARISTIYINRFIKNNNIDMTRFEKIKYSSFNDFFTRKVNNTRPEKTYEQNVLISLCDAKLTTYEISDELTIKVKNSVYNMENLINEKVKSEYQGGKCLVFRLCPDDYHRYHAFDDYEIIKRKKIKGRLHTVNPISYDSYQVFKENQREVSLLKTKNFKNVYQIEVGALNVGKIKNTNKKELKKYEEKGYFLFGGSTIILLFQKDVIKLDEDIEKYSKQNIEVKINYGEKIGVKHE